MCMILPKPEALCLNSRADWEHWIWMTGNENKLGSLRISTLLEHILQNQKYGFVILNLPNVLTMQQVDGTEK